MTDALFTRSFELDDISIRAGGDGRTVTAYATVFNTPAEIQDQDGHYREQIAPTAFGKTLTERMGRVQVLFNHGRVNDGSSTALSSVPIGTPVTIEPDARGLKTVTRYNRSELADSVLEAIRGGSIRAQSFSGRFIKSDSRGPYRASRSGELTLVTRSEIALQEYGPVVYPAYEGAQIIGVRSAEQGNIDVEDVTYINDVARSYATSQGWALGDGSCTIRPLDNHGRADLENALSAAERIGVSDTLREHIVSRAEALELAELIPDRWTSDRGLMICADVSVMVCKEDDDDDDEPDDDDDTSTDASGEADDVPSREMPTAVTPLDGADEAHRRPVPTAVKPLS